MSDYPRFRARLAELLDTDFYTIEWLDEQFASGRHRLFADGDSALAALIEDYPTGAKGVRIVFALGDVGTIATRLRPAAEAWGRENGCIRLLSEGRPGWQRVLEPFGYELHSVTLRKEL